MYNQRKLGIALTYISELIKILTSLIYTPIMLRYLGQSEYGLYQLVHSVVAYLSLLNLGFTASYVKFYSVLKKEHKKEDVFRLNGMFLIIFLVISCIAILCGIVMIVNIRDIFKRGLSDIEYDKARVLMMIMILNLALTFPKSVFTCITSAHEKFFFQRLLHVLNNVLNPFLTLPLLLMGYGSVGMVVVTTGLTVAQLVADIWFVCGRMKEKFIFNHFNFSMLKSIWQFTFFIFLNQLIDQINWNVDRVLLGRMMGTAAVAVYSLGAHINTMYVSISSAVSSVFVPKINKIVSETNDNHQLSLLFTRIGRIQFMILGLVMTGFVFFGKPFMRLWGGSGYAESYYVGLWLIIPVTIPLIQNLGIEIQRAKNKHQARAVVYFCIAIGNIFLSIFLIGEYGVVGASIGTAVSLIIGNIVFMNWYYHNRIGLEIKEYWLSILSFWRFLIPPVIAGMLMMRYIHVGGWLGLAAVILLYTVVYCVSLWVLGMNASEKKMVTDTIIKIDYKNRKQI